MLPGDLADHKSCCLDHISHGHAGNLHPKRIGGSTGTAFCKIAPHRHVESAV